jgi:hypothetical protein
MLPAALNVYVLLLHICALPTHRELIFRVIQVMLMENEWIYAQELVLKRPLIETYRYKTREFFQT